MVQIEENIFQIVLHFGKCFPKSIYKRKIGYLGVYEKYVGGREKEKNSLNILSTLVQ
jgi:hypothetical protein